MSFGTYSSDAPGGQFVPIRFEISLSDGIQGERERAVGALEGLTSSAAPGKLFRRFTAAPLSSSDPGARTRRGVATDAVGTAPSSLSSLSPSGDSESPPTRSEKNARSTAGTSMCAGIPALTNGERARTLLMPSPVAVVGDEVRSCAAGCCTGALHSISASGISAIAGAVASEEAGASDSCARASSSAACLPLSRFFAC